MERLVVDDLRVPKVLGENAPAVAKDRRVMVDASFIVQVMLMY